MLAPHLLVRIIDSDWAKLLFYVRKMRKDPEARRAVLMMIKRGMVTVPEAARLAGVSRQLIRSWCKADGVSVDRARLLLLTKQWRRLLARR